MTPIDQRSAQAIAREGDFAARLIDTASAIVLVLDPEAKIVLFNRYMEELCGWTLAEARGRDWFELFVPPAYHEELRAVFALAIADQPVVGQINPIQTKRDEQRQIEWHASTLRDDQGRVTGILNVGQDITEKLEIQAKLGESERLATIGMMAAVFAHEVGNPLNSIYLQAQLLRRHIDNPHPPQPLAPKLDTIMSEIRRLNALLEDFRSFHRPDRIKLEPTDVNAVLSDVSETLDPRAEASQVALERALAPKLPRVAGNANKLKQVFINLCKNAIEAMPEGGVLHLRSRSSDAREGEGRVIVEVRDTGTGIDEEVDVFEPFATTKPAGTGLGLALVREIVTMHDGHVHFRSSPAGTIFTVDLPAL